MSLEFLISVSVAAGIASLGLGWFVYVLPSVRRLEKITRYGIYAAIWLAYFASVIVIIGAVR